MTRRIFGCLMIVAGFCLLGVLTDWWFAGYIAVTVVMMALFFFGFMLLAPDEISPLRAKKKKDNG